MLARKPFIIAMCFVFSVMLVAGILFNFSIADAGSVAVLPVRSYSRMNSNNSAPAIPAHKNNTLLSVADVKEYVLTHRCPIGPTVSGDLPKIIAIQLMTSRNASRVMRGEYVGLPDDGLVYYVLLKGPFIAENIKTITSVGVEIADRMEEVFDAYTGNQLVWGT